MTMRIPPWESPNERRGHQSFRWIGASRIRQAWTRAKIKADLLATTLFVVDSGTGYPLAVATPGRRAEQTAFLVTVVINFIDRLGYQKVYLRTDGLPSIRDLAAKTRAQRKHETIEQVTPRYSHQSNGRVERTIQTVRKQMVTMHLALEDAYQIKLTPNHTVWGWLARHAAWLVARYLVKLNNRTAFMEASDLEYRGEILP